MTRCLLSLFAAFSLFAQTRSPKTLQTHFPDGTALEIRTESTSDKAPLSTSGSVIVGPDNSVKRIVLGREGVLLFAYRIEAQKISSATFRLRIQPIDPMQELVATLSASREFSPLQAGDEVQVDILRNPGTNEKIFDVIRVANRPEPVSKPPASRQIQFSFQSCRVAIAGRTIDESERSWLIGAAASITLPGRGVFYFALDPAPKYPFEASGWVDRNVLRFHAGTDLVEVTCRSNVLQKSDYRTIWVYKDPSSPKSGYRTMERLVLLQRRLDQLLQTYRVDHPDIKALKAQIENQRRQIQELSRTGFQQYVLFQTADDVEMLIPKAELKNDD